MATKKKKPSTKKPQKKRVLKVDKTTGKQLGGATGAGFMPGKSGNPKGRPPGARSKLATEFYKALNEDFKKFGVSVIKAVRVEHPEVYLKTIAAILPKEITLDGSISHEHQHTHETISDTAQWINDMLGGTKASKAEKPRTH